MTYRSSLLGAAGICALAVLGANPAHAAGTIAGSTITNTVSVTFTVNSIAQTGTTASDTLTVDRRINLIVAEVGTTTTTVTPGAASQVTAFTVTNTSNAPLDFALAVAQQTGGAGAHSNTDSFDVSNVRIFRDVNNNSTFESGTDTPITFLDEVAADASVQVIVVADVPLAQANNGVAAVTLTATGREAGGTGTQGAALVQTTGANTGAMDTVFGDGSGATDSARDAAFSARDDYTVSAATLSAIKSSRVISDPVNGVSANAKMIPGAVIQYCIAISNASGSATANSVTVNDPIPANLTYDSSFGVKTNGTATIVSGVATCAADTTGTGTMASNTVSGTLASVAAGETKTVVFQATIN